MRKAFIGFIMLAIVYGVSSISLSIYSIGMLEVSDNYKLENIELGLSFPPVSDDNQRLITKYHLDQLNIKKIRFAEDWSYREPTRGSFKWNSLDKRMDFCEENDIELLLTIQSNGPEWACNAQNERSCVFSNLTAWEIYVRALLERYSNKIEKIQFGNEWQSNWWYVGSAEEFVFANNLLYDAVQELSPETKFVLGGFACGTLEAMAAIYGYIHSFISIEGDVIDQEEILEYKNSEEVLKGKERIEHVLNNAKFDMLDLHFYDEYEIWPVLLEMIDDLVPNAPVICTEFGGPNLNYLGISYNDNLQASELIKYIETLDSMEVDEAYFFKLVEGGSANAAHQKSGLLTSLLSKKPAYRVLQSYTNQVPLIDAYILIYSGVLTVMIMVLVSASYGIYWIIQGTKMKE